MYNFVFNGDENYLKYTVVCITSIVKNTDVHLSYAHFLAQQNVSVEDSLEKANSISSSLCQSMSSNSLQENLQENGAEQEKYIFHILSDTISPQTREKLDHLEQALNGYFEEISPRPRQFSVQIKTYTMPDTMFHGQPRWRGSYLPYYRLQSQELIKTDCEKLLYLDGDTLVNCDIRELFAIDISDKICAAVANKNTVSWTLDSRLGQNGYTFTASHFYFNAGVILINFKKWKEENIEDKALNFLRNYIPKAPDQDALNAVITDPRQIPFKWNVMIHPSFISENSYAHNCIYKDESPKYNNPHKKSDYLEGLQSPNIIHYSYKPWTGSGLLITEAYQIAYFPYFDLWWDMAQKTPIFNEELLAIKKSPQYLKKVDQENLLIQTIRSKSLSYFWFKFKRETRPFMQKLEAPFKKFRNHFRSKKVMRQAR